MLKRLISTIITMIMILSFKVTIPVKATSNISIGQYLQMGSYYGEPILWRCVDIDENGPLMLADRILTIKPFDAQGNHKYIDGTPQAVDTYYYRSSYGSNLWETSNIRSWLNSTAAAGNVVWLDGCPPTENKVWNGYNDYASEKGFLADGNFTESERSVIKIVTQKSILNGIDVPKLKVGGNANHIYDSNISSVVTNYDSAYYHYVTDNIFLLDVKQLNKVYQNSAILGTYYYVGRPTQKAVENSEFKDNSNLNSGNTWYSWSRTPDSSPHSPYRVRDILSNGAIHYAHSGGYIGYPYAGSEPLGVRPAFYINTSSVNFISGNGTESTPYIQSNITGILANDVSKAVDTVRAKVRIGQDLVEQDVTAPVIAIVGSVPPTVTDFNINSKEFGVIFAGIKFKSLSNWTALNYNQGKYIIKLVDPTGKITPGIYPAVNYCDNEESTPTEINIIN